MKSYSVSLPDEDVAWVDKIRTGTGLSRSATISDCISQCRRRRQAAKAAIVAWEALCRDPDVQRLGREWVDSSMKLFAETIAPKLLDVEGVLDVLSGGDPASEDGVQRRPRFLRSGTVESGSANVVSSSSVTNERVIDETQERQSQDTGAGPGAPTDEGGGCRLLQSGGRDAGPLTHGADGQLP